MCIEKTKLPYQQNRYGSKASYFFLVYCVSLRFGIVFVEGDVVVRELEFRVLLFGVLDFCFSLIFSGR